MRLSALLVVMLVGCGASTASQTDAGTDGGNSPSSDGGNNPTSDGGKNPGNDGGNNPGNDAGSDGGADAHSYADGQTEAWTQLSPLPTATANHCAVAMGDALIIAGGNTVPDGGTSFVSTDEVRAATVAADGTLANWTLVGHLPSPGTACVLAANDDTLVLLGGLFDDATLDGKIWKATLGATGLTPWVEIGTLPYARRALSAGAALKGTTLWLTDSQLSSEGPEEAILAKATLGTTLSAWQKTKYWPQFRGQPLGAFSDDAAFVIGGYDDTGTLTDVTKISLADETFTSVSPLPEARTYGAAAYADGYLFATGGRTAALGALPLATVFSSAVGGAWTTTTALPEPRSNHTATVVGDWLFVVGGGNNGPGLNTVYRARVKHGRSP